MDALSSAVPVRESVKSAYRRQRAKRSAFAVTLVPIVIALFVAGMCMGSADISVPDVFAALAGRVDDGTVMIVWTLRLPRLVTAIIAGIALGSCGAVMQVLLRNPLADPYMLGISSAAGFGASLAIVFGVGFGVSAAVTNSLMVTGNAFLFSMLSSVLILSLSGGRRGGPDKMVLFGLALLFFFQAMTTMIQYFGDAEAVKAAMFWTVGDLGKSGWDKIVVMVPVVVVGCGFLTLQAGNLNALNIGDANAKSLGVNVRLVRVSCMLVSSLMVSVVVSITGTIGFVGLVAPHMVRLLVGADNRVLVPASGLAGACLLLLSDTVARTALSPVILPVGAVTAFLGVPLFVYLILRKKGDLS
jgi:iron complex transport system permease protein